MSDREPDLPFPPVNNRLTPVIYAGGRRVIDSGSLVIERTATVEIKIEDLTFVLEFTGDPKSGVKYDIRDGKLHTVFDNDDSIFGASFNPVQVATLNGRPLYLSVYYQTIGPDGRHVVYTLMTEGEDGQ